MLAGRKVLEAAAGSSAQPREEAEAAVAVHGGWRVLKLLDVPVSRAAVKVALEEGGHTTMEVSQCAIRGVAFALRGGDRPGWRCE